MMDEEMPSTSMGPSTPLVATTSRPASRLAPNAPAPGPCAMLQQPGPSTPLQQNHNFNWNHVQSSPYRISNADPLQRVSAGTRGSVLTSQWLDSSRSFGGMGALPGDLTATTGPQPWRPGSTTGSVMSDASGLSCMSGGVSLLSNMSQLTINTDISTSSHIHPNYVPLGAGASHSSASSSVENYPPYMWSGRVKEALQFLQQGPPPYQNSEHYARLREDALTSIVAMTKKRQHKHWRVEELDAVIKYVFRALQTENRDEMVQKLLDVICHLVHLNPGERKDQSRALERLKRFIRHPRENVNPVIVICHKLDVTEALFIVYISERTLTRQEQSVERPYIRDSLIMLRTLLSLTSKAHEIASRIQLPTGDLLTHLVLVTTKCDFSKSVTKRMALSIIGLIFKQKTNANWKQWFVITNTDLMTQLFCMIRENQEEELLHTLVLLLNSIVDDLNSQYAEGFIRLGGVECLTELLAHSSPRLVQTALKCLCNVSNEQIIHKLPNLRDTVQAVARVFGCADALTVNYATGFVFNVTANDNLVKEVLVNMKSPVEILRILDSFNVYFQQPYNNIRHICEEIMYNALGSLVALTSFTATDKTQPIPSYTLDARRQIGEMAISAQMLLNTIVNMEAEPLRYKALLIMCRVSESYNRFLHCLAAVTTNYSGKSFYEIITLLLIDSCQSCKGSPEDPKLRMAERTANLCSMVLNDEHLAPGLRQEFSKHYLSLNQCLERRECALVKDRLRALAAALSK